MSFLAQKRSNILLQNKYKNAVPTPAAHESGNFYYQEVAKLTGSGGWSVNFQEKTTFLDSEARRILELPDNYRTSLRNALDFYPGEHKEKALTFFTECSMGHPFSTTIKMCTYHQREFWVRAVGKPIFSKTDEVIGIQGVFQDINDDKLKELQLLKSLKVIETQNAKLQNFAKIITHSLRSHASNLEMTLDLLADDCDPMDKEELLKALMCISENVTTTVGHLSELSSIQTRTADSREPVSFEEVLNKVKNKLSITLNDARAEIFSDFSEVPEIKYIRSYLESIFLNLITNAIKFRSPERSPIIEIYSFSEDDQTCLMVKDNGSGIDLDKHGNRIFNMYQTFHSNEGCEGVGLFLIKNKIESLQGTISVTSRPEKGTTFTVRF